MSQVYKLTLILSLLCLKCQDIKKINLQLRLNFVSHTNVLPLISQELAVNEIADYLLFLSSVSFILSDFKTFTIHYTIIDSFNLLLPFSLFSVSVSLCLPLSKLLAVLRIYAPSYLTAELAKHCPFIKIPSKQDISFHPLIAKTV